jgi:hypothetical protein
VPALRAVLAQTWPGWEIRWAHGGLSEIRRYLNDVGVDDIEESPVALARDESLVSFQPMDLAGIEQDSDFFLVTVAEIGTPVQAYATWTEEAAALWLGESLLSQLPESAKVAERDTAAGCWCAFRPGESHRRGLDHDDNRRIRRSFPAIVAELAIRILRRSL